MAAIQEQALADGTRWAEEMASARARDAALREEHLDSLASTIKTLRAELEETNESFASKLSKRVVTESTDLFDHEV